MAEETTASAETTAATDTGAAITGDAPAETASAPKTDGAPAAAPAANAEDGAAKDDGAALNGEAPAEDAIDWEKITDDEYLKKVDLPEGQQWDKDAMAEYTKLLKENKVDPKLFSKFVAKDIEMQKARGEKAKAASDKKMAEQKAAFKAAGEEFRRTYTPEQVKEMNSTLSKIDDPTFRELVAKSPLANNKTMGKMLLAYRQVYGEDAVSGTGAAGVGGEKSFVDVWTHNS